MLCVWIEGALKSDCLIKMSFLPLAQNCLKLSVYIVPVCSLPKYGLDKNKLLNIYQYLAFDHSIAQWALLETTNNWSININNKLLNGVVYIDLDTIDHAIILRKLVNYRLDQSSIQCFASYLANRNQKCNVNGALSSVSELTCGVSQGSVPGSLLFLMYIALTQPAQNC